MTKTEKRIEALKAEFDGKNFSGPDCRNKRAATGWAVIGHAGWTRAIQGAGLPTASYWSGSAPTPSTQAPAQIVKFCEDNFDD